MKIFYTSKFKKTFKKLPIWLKRKSIEKEKLFRKNICDKTLKTHKLSWKLKWYYSFSIDYSYRIMFEIDNNNNVYFINIWNHSIYK